MSYSIEEDCLFEGAGYTLRVYNEKPSLETLLTDETESMDITAPISVEEVEGVLWVYAQFDVNVSQTRIGTRQGFVALRVEDEDVLMDYGMSEELYAMYKRFQEVA